MDVIHPNDPAEDLDAVKVVHGEHGAPLVHVAEEAKALTLAVIVVANEVNVNLR